MAIFETIQEHNLFTCVADGYSVSDIQYYWNFKKTASPVSLNPFGAKLPQFMVVDVGFSDTLQILSTGNYSRLSLRFIMKRQLGFYIIQIYLPSSLIVIISWVSFWLSRDAAPARVSLGVTTVLTMTTLMSTMNSSMPKVSYAKSIDYYVITCFFMVFMSLLEYAAVGYSNKKLRDRQSKASKKRSMAGYASLLFGISPTATTANDCTAASTASTARARFESAGKLPKDSIVIHKRNAAIYSRPSTAPLGSCRQSVESLLFTHAATNPVISSMKLPLQPKRNKCYLKLTPSGIDKWSRVLFPAGFFLFNLLYWVVYSHLGQQRAQQLAEI